MSLHNIHWTFFFFFTSVSIYGTASFFQKSEYYSVFGILLIYCYCCPLGHFQLLLFLNNTVINILEYVQIHSINYFRGNSWAIRYVHFKLIGISLSSQHNNMLNLFSV